jgi:hypothetical protein
MRDESKEIKINLPMYHYRILQLWAFMKSVPFSVLASNIIQARCEDKGNQQDIDAALKLRAPQAPYRTTPDGLRQQIWGDEEDGDKVAIPVEAATYTRLLVIANNQGLTVEQYINQLAQNV